MESKRSLDHYQLPPDKTAVVIGATTGIGAAVARKLSSVGCSRVIILGRNEERGMKVINRMKQLSKEKVQADFVKGDSSIENTLSDVQVDYMVLCQNGPPTGTINLNEDGEGTEFTIQVISRFLIAYLFASHTLISQGGKVMFIANPGLSYDKLDIGDLSLKKVLNERFPQYIFYHVHRGLVETETFDIHKFPFPLNYFAALGLVFMSTTPDEFANIPVQILASADLGEGKFWDHKLQPKSPGKWASDRGNREKLWDKLLTMTGSG